MFKHYLATALRHLSRHKTTTAINVLCLAFGFVCFALAYGMVRYTTTADSYHEKADRTYVLTQRSEILGKEALLATQPWVGYGLAKHLKNDFPEIEIAARAFRATDTPISTASEQRFVELAYADPEFLDVVDLNFIVGDRRTALGSPHSAVITAELALKLYGRTDVVGESILVADRETVHINGVVEPQRQPSHISTDSSPGELRFSLLVSMDTFQAMGQYIVETDSAMNWIFFNRNAITYLVFPESRAITPQQLLAQLPAFYKRKVPSDCCLAVFGLRPISEVGAAGFDFLLKRDVTGLSQTAVLLMIGLVVLSVSCLSYANLASAQAVTRLKEIALYRVVGAHRSQIVRQSLFEALLVSLCAAACAVLVFPLIAQALHAKLGFDIGTAMFDNPVFWLVLLLTAVGAALLASVYPALVAARVQPTEALKGGHAPASTLPILRTLLVMQFAVAGFLFVATVVMYTQNERIWRTPLSATQDPVVRIYNRLSTARVDPNTLRNELLKHPAIKSIGGSNLQPGMLGQPQFVLRGGPEPTSRSWIASTPTVDYDFFATMDIPLLAGRNFDRTSAQDRAEPPRGNVIIDRAMATEYGWQNPSDAIGKSIYTGGNDRHSPGAPSIVIGVVENAKLMPIVTDTGASTMYQLSPGNSISNFVKVSKDDVAAGLAAIDETWRKLSPTVPLKRSFVDDEYEKLYRQVSSVAYVFRSVAFIALFICALGLIGIATHAIAQRTFEIGIRRTLGATVRQVLSMLLKDFSKPILIANVIAWPLAYIAAQAYSSFFADRAPITAAPFVLSLVLGLTIAWLAVLRQATRAARMNPAVVLRHE